MRRKLIGIDLDYTTLNNAGEVSDKTRAVLQAAQAAGHIVSIVTGRPARLATGIYDYIGLKSPMINFNGGLGHKPHENWEYEYSKLINHDLAFDIFDQAADLGIDLLAAENKNHAWSATTGLRPVGELAFFPSDRDQLHQLNKQNLREDVNAIILHGENPVQMQAAQAFLQARYGNEAITVKTWGDQHVVEVSAAGISKTTGLEYLRKHYDIDPDDVYAFGDEMNDFEMIEYAKHGIVMANGNPALKKIANDITEYSNEADGLARYLEQALAL
ncbi:putative phosphatase [Weissella oryzae SG25]|uniref:Putative phosphatase n=1 Tax=Weissella oryzae (strain DSM 25784 / JCM 18191 / LMG 30913 / SG25) TaxID=1329250 RepID=A0A069CRU7_WEIOS|nr:Cof-type HAD-IIB family hydrolase [Weissella oryzae]GAK30515.1 putative phosphatase [Weissella oryzae SG25]